MERREGDGNIEQKLTALRQLDQFFTNPQTGKVNIGKRLTSLRAYRNATIRMAAEKGLSDEERLVRVRETLMADAIIDPEDPDHATEQMRVLQEGYDADPELWDKWIGRRAKHFELKRVIDDLLS